MPGSDGLLEAVELVYDLEAPSVAWLQAVCRAAERAFRPSLGTLGYFYEATPARDRIVLSDWAVERGPERSVELVRALEASAPPVVVQNAYLKGNTAGFIADGIPRPLQPLGRAVYREQVGARDAFYLMARVTRSRSVCVAFLERDAQPQSRARVLRPWKRFAAHLTAAQRLRAQLGEVQARFTPDGRLVDAVDGAVSARAVLREAVRRRETARTRRGRRSSEEALELWRGLVAGRWSLVDSYESDGRRYIVAHENEPGVEDPRQLSPREQAVAKLLARGLANKTIGFELGLGTSTVGEIVSRLRKKLAVESRAELVALLARFEGRDGAA